MKTLLSYRLYFAICFCLIIGLPVMAQVDDQDKKNEPTIKWEVKKEYDENGNLIRYDSVASTYWHYHSFGDHDFDSSFCEFFKSMPEDFDKNLFLWKDMPHAYPDFPDIHWFFNDSIKKGPHSSLPYIEPFPDDFYEHFYGPDRFLEDSLFSEFFHHPYSFQPMPDLEEIFKRQEEIFNQFFHHYHLPGDSLFHKHPQNYTPGMQKKSGKEIDI